MIVLLTVREAIGETMQLQHFGDTFTNKQWQERYKEEKCRDRASFQYGLGFMTFINIYLIICCFNVIISYYDIALS